MKKVLFSLILSLVLFAGLCAVSFAAEVDLGDYEMAESMAHCPGQGDVNFDGTVNSADARLILRQAVALERFSSAQKAVADLDGNAKINSADARLALRIAVRLEKQPPHSTEDVLISEATCSSQGVIAQVCTACNKVVSYSKTGISGHLLGNWENVKEATCSEKGLKQRCCTICGKVLEKKDISASHTFRYEDGFKGADCMNVVKAKQICTKCGFTQTKTINPLGKHTFTWVTTKAATCSKPGLMEYQCSVCGDKGKGQSKVITCSGTKIEQTIKAPTCTETGKSAKVCYVCGEKEDEKVLPATEHEFNYNIKKVVLEPTHMEKGIAKVSCKKCGATKEIEIERLNHTVEEDGVVIKAPSCSEEGIQKVNCKYCGIVESPIPATGNHTKSESKKTVRAASCTENKLVSNYCTVCGKYEGIYEPVEVMNTKTAHTPAKKWTQTIAPTCTKEGTRVKYCTVCNGVAVSEKVEKLAHTPGGDWTVTKKATCSAEGEKVKYCTVCQKVAQKAAIEKLAHKPASSWTVVKKATCSAQGTRVIKCTVCREAVRSESIKKLDHTPGAWRVAKAATCSEEGKSVKMCTVCKAIVAEKAIPKLDHTPGNWTTTVPNTCARDGVKVKYCTVCRDIVAKGTIPKTDDHKYGSWSTTKAATCVATGEERRTCKGCDKYETNIIPKNMSNHISTETYTAGAVTPTCTQAGQHANTYYKCCDTLKTSGAVIPATGHSTKDAAWCIESFGTVNEDGTLAAGINCIRCTVCSEIAESKAFNKFDLEFAKLIKFLPNSSLKNDENAVLYFKIDGDASASYVVSYTYDGLDVPVTFEAVSNTEYSIDLSQIPAEAVVHISVATEEAE